MDLTEALEATGLTGYEARLYLTLLADGPLSGYEAAKLSGISRSNVYLSLKALQEKGGAEKIDGDVAKFIAVPAAEYCAGRERRYREVLDYIRASAPHRKTAPDAYITVNGDRNIIGKMKSLVSSASARIYVSQHEAECRLVKEELAGAVRRGLRVVLVTSGGFSVEGAETVHTEKKRGQVRIIADSACVLTGTLGGDGQSSCLFTSNETLVTLFKEALRNEIDLVQIRNERKQQHVSD